MRAASTGTCCRLRRCSNGNMKAIVCRMSVIAIAAVRNSGSWSFVGRVDTGLLALTG
jgi:hypothetical protein